MIKTNSSLLLLAFIIVPLTASPKIKQVLLPSRYFLRCLVIVLGRVSFCKQRRLTQGWSRCGVAGHSSDRQMNGQLSSEMEDDPSDSTRQQYGCPARPKCNPPAVSSIFLLYWKLNSSKDNPFHACFPLDMGDPRPLSPTVPSSGDSHHWKLHSGYLPPGQLVSNSVCLELRDPVPLPSPIQMPSLKSLQNVLIKKIINCVNTCEPLFISSLHAVVFPLKTTHNMVRTLKNILYQGAFTGKMVYYLQVKWHESCDGLKYSRKIKCVHVCVHVCVCMYVHVCV